MSRGYEQLLEDNWNKIQGANISGAGLISPFFLFKDKDDFELASWLENTLWCIQDENEPRARQQIDYARFYSALEMLADPSRRTRAVDRDNQALPNSALFTMNHAFDFVNQAVSRLMRYSLQMNVLPNKNEYNSRLAARLQKRVIDHIFQVNEVSDLARLLLTEGKVCGESFLWIFYDPDKGDVDPTYIEATQEKERNPKIKFTDSQGNEVNLQKVKRTGEVTYELSPTWFTLHEPAFRWKDVNYAFRGTIKHIDQIKAENPGVDVSNTRPIPRISRAPEGHFGPGLAYGEWVIEWEFFHRYTPLLPQGYYVRFLEGNQILRRGDLPYSHGLLPVARWTDKDDLLNAHGRSFFDDIVPPLVIFNKLQNVMFRGIATTCYPKMAVARGSTDYTSLANGPFLVEYDWPMKPDAINFQAFGSELFSFSDNMMKQIQQLSGTFSISRGEQLPNARAAAILNVYQEQETEREAPQIAKYNKWAEKVAQLSIGTAGDYYTVEDGRTLRVFGKTNYYRARSIDDVAKLSGPYDIRVERTTALSESKQGRIDQISTLSQMPLIDHEHPYEAGRPGVFTREQVLRMIEVGDTAEFFELATAAAEKADSENEDMFEGLQMQPPAKWENHIVHWNQHYLFMQSREFTDTQGLPPEVVENFTTHLQLTEEEMYMLATKSLAFCQLLASNPAWPALFEFGPRPTLTQLVMIHQQPPMPSAPPVSQNPTPQPQTEPEDMPPEGGEGAGPVASPEPMPEQAQMPMPEMPMPEAMPDAEMMPMRKLKNWDFVLDENGRMVGAKGTEELVP